MQVIIESFLENMTLIIAYMFLTLKAKEFILIKFDVTHKLFWFVPIALSLLSLFIMHYPLEFEGMRVDLRSVPIFFISYLAGWKFGIVSIILPTWLRYSLGGPTVMQGIFQAIIIPFLLGAIFHKRDSYTPPYTIISIKHMLLVFTFYEIILVALMLLTTPISLKAALIMMVFQTLALLSIGLIQNDSNRNILYRQELEFQSRHDSMTNIYNLRHFRSKIEHLMHLKKPFVIAMFDVDHFKNYNDTHGHPAGDAVLRMIGQLLSESLKNGDVFARYGGEEFIVCLPNISNMEEALEILEAFRAKVEAYKFYGEESQPTGKLTISIGISGFSEGKSLDELISAADNALYSSKKSGRNTISY
jgi:diguanylate cyclase